MKNVEAYDVSAWGYVHNCTSLADAVMCGVRENGVYHVDTEAGVLDILSKNMECLRPGGTILVGFNGAVSNRSGKKAPFFSGARISDNIKVPLVSISDPSLALDKNLPLAWYAGNEWLPDLQSELSLALNEVHNAINADMLFFGGSGGGFAALAVAAKVDFCAKVLVWNPQTSILDYNFGFVRQYVNACFPTSVGRYVAGCDAGQTLSLYKKIFDEFNITHSLQGAFQYSNVDVFYLQNKSDWHFGKHAIPFLKSHDIVKGDEGWVSNSRFGIRFIEGGWGNGHAPLPKDILERALLEVIEGEDMSSVADNLTSLCGYDEGVKALDVFSNAELSGEIFPNKIRAGFEVSSSFRDVSIEYAFYLLVDGVRTNVRWYEKDRFVEFVNFTCQEDGQKIEIVGFVRDGNGEKMSKRILLRSREPANG